MAGHRESERRREKRQQLRLPVRFWDLQGTSTHAGLLVDESEGGAFIESEDNLPLLSRVRIEGPGVVYDAVVVRVFWVPPDLRHEQSGGIAVRFLERKAHISEAELEDDDGNVILAFPARRQAAR